MEASRLQSESSDYISDLPDNVLHHILSFLPIKDCIRTSFLSRRWRYLWTLVPNLDFDGLIFSPKVKFMNFVDSVLRHRNGCGIQSFRLRFGYYYCESSRVQSWIVSAISHNVRELSISSYTMEPFDDLPSCIFTCSSLTTLTLNLFHSTIRLPSSCHLPFLKTIELSSVIFSDDNLNLFFSHCPNLETFSLQGCFVRNLRILHITAPYLQRLCIHGMRQSGSDDSFLNEIMISTPRLLSLECSDIDMFLENNISLANVDISFENASSLVSASIDFSFRQDNFARMNSLLRGLSNAKVLALSSGTVRLLALVPNLLGQLPTFSNLIHLKLSANSDDTLRILTSFLRNAPNLEFLSVDLLPCWYWFNNEVCFEPQKVECVIDHLKVVKIRDFRGDEKEIAIVKYMLQHAHILERMVIVFSKQLSAKSDRQMEIQEDILMHPRSSVNSEVICGSIV